MKLVLDDAEGEGLAPSYRCDEDLRNLVLEDIEVEGPALLLDNIAEERTGLLLLHDEKLVMDDVEGEGVADDADRYAK